MLLPHEPLRDSHQLTSEVVTFDGREIHLDENGDCHLESLGGRHLVRFEDQKSHCFELTFRVPGLGDLDSVFITVENGVAISREHDEVLRSVACE